MIHGGPLAGYDRHSLRLLRPDALPGTVSKFFGSVIEELIEVNFPVVFRGLHGQEQKLVEVEAVTVVVLVEGLMVEDV